MGPQRVGQNLVTKQFSTNLIGLLEGFNTPHLSCDRHPVSFVHSWNWRVLCVDYKHKLSESCILRSELLSAVRCSEIILPPSLTLFIGKMSTL